MILRKSPDRAQNAARPSGAGDGADFLSYARDDAATPPRLDGEIAEALSKIPRRERC
jgi:hypothetical protein